MYRLLEPGEKLPSKHKDRNDMIGGLCLMAAIVVFISVFGDEGSKAPPPLTGESFFCLQSRELHIRNTYYYDGADRYTHLQGKAAWGQLEKEKVAGKVSCLVPTLPPVEETDPYSNDNYDDFPPEDFDETDGKGYPSS